MGKIKSEGGRAGGSQIHKNVYFLEVQEGENIKARGAA
jgi:hypothetical protein